MSVTTSVEAPALTAPSTRTPVAPANVGVSPTLTAVKKTLLLPDFGSRTIGLLNAVVIYEHRW